ncbi:MAG: FKBP-type peptidyl-prolyl cis-trans isomerase [Bacteroidetes bacterium]|nr:FKBP-type peptidyl-prolyl cis-trans isomerase [Bacteroidota bacterium]
MKKTVILPALFPVFFFFSCDDAKYPGFTEAAKGVFYKLHIPGESGKKAGENDYYEIRMQNKYGGKVFYDSEFQTGTGTLFVQASTSPYFSVLSEGDSATFMLPGGDLHMIGTPDTGTVEMNVKVIRIVNEAAYEKISENRDPDLDEQMIIQRYMKKNKINCAQDSTGLIFQSEKEGIGEKPSTGKTIVIHYTGTLMNGVMFDDTRAENKPFSFTWGQPDQVLPGLEQALHRMKAGAKAKIILPSALAFGTNGSSNGIVPPHTPVIYEIELVSVQ